MQIMEQIKAHPYITAGIALVGGVLLYTIFFSGGSSSGGATTQAQLDAANFATQTQGATNYAIAQAAMQSQDFAVQQQADVTSQYIAAQKELGLQGIQAGIQANALQAGNVNNYLTAQQNIAQDTLSQSALQQELGAQSLELASAVQANALSVGAPSSYNSPFGSFSIGVNPADIPAAASPPPPPPVSPPAINPQQPPQVIIEQQSPATSGQMPMIPLVSNTGMVNGQMGDWLTYANGQSVFQPNLLPQGGPNGSLINAPLGLDHGI